MKSASSLCRSAPEIHRTPGTRFRNANGYGGPRSPPQGKPFSPPTPASQSPASSGQRFCCDGLAALPALLAWPQRHGISIGKRWAYEGDLTAAQAPHTSGRVSFSCTDRGQPRGSSSRLAARSPTLRLTASPTTTSASHALRSRPRLTDCAGPAACAVSVSDPSVLPHGVCAIDLALSP